MQCSSLREGVVSSHRVIQANTQHTLLGTDSVTGQGYRLSRQISAQPGKQWQEWSFLSFLSRFREWDWEAIFEVIPLPSPLPQAYIRQWEWQIRKDKPLLSRYSRNEAARFAPVLPLADLPWQLLHKHRGAELSLLLPLNNLSYLGGEKILNYTDADFYTTSTTSSLSFIPPVYHEEEYQTWFLACFCFPQCFFLYVQGGKMYTSKCLPVCVLVHLLILCLTVLCYICLHQWLFY